MSGEPASWTHATAIRTGIEGRAHSRRRERRQSRNSRRLGIPRLENVLLHGSALDSTSCPQCVPVYHSFGVLCNTSAERLNWPSPQVLAHTGRRISVRTRNARYSADPDVSRHGLEAIWCTRSAWCAHPS